MFTPDEKRQLEAFCKVVDDINGCRFIREFGNQSHHIFVGKLPDGTVKDEWPRYDDDDFRAMLTHYRKLRLQDGHETNLFRVLNVIKRRDTDDQQREKLTQYKDAIVEEGGSWCGASLIDETGQQVLFSQDDVDNLILNGEVFHADPGKFETLSRLVGQGPLTKAVAFWNYVSLLRTVIYYANERLS